MNFGDGDTLGGQNNNNKTCSSGKGGQLKNGNQGKPQESVKKHMVVNILLHGKKLFQFKDDPNRRRYYESNPIPKYSHGILYRRLGSGVERIRTLTARHGSRSLSSII